MAFGTQSVELVHLYRREELGLIDQPVSWAIFGPVEARVLCVDLGLAVVAIARRDHCGPAPVIQHAREDRRGMACKLQMARMCQQCGGLACTHGPVDEIKSLHATSLHANAMKKQANFGRLRARARVACMLPGLWSNGRHSPIKVLHEERNPDLSR